LHPREDQGVSLKGVLLAAGPVICILGLAAELWYALSGTDRFHDWVVLLSLSEEQNLPTWYSSILLFGSGWMLWHRAAAATSYRRHWQAMSLGLFLASLDDFAELHERLGGWLGSSGVLYFDWILPASAAMLVLAVLYIPFVRDLPGATRKGFLTAGAIFLSGALLMEMPLGYWTERHGPDNLEYALIDWVEESLEILGASLFVLAVQRELRRAHD
jgi:hypothetical protein